MGSFPSSSGNKYILVAIDYVSKWVEAQAFPASDARNVVNFLKRLFARFRIPKALISDRGTHFCNYQMERAMKRKEMSHKLDESLWAFQNALKTPLGMILFRIIYGKACHLLVELENKAYWAIKACNIDLTKAGANRFLQINELDELRLDSNESSISYKERTKRWHDKRIKTQTKYKKGDKVLLFNSRLRLFLRKLKSRWYRPFAVSKDMKNGAIELYDEDGNEFIVNKQRVKPINKKHVKLLIKMIYHISFHKTPESLCRIEKRTKNGIEPISPTMTINRIVLECEERMKLHQEKEMKFDKWRSKIFNNERPAPVKDECEVTDEGGVT
ncbi:reverse transcriptase domain-containing protein [Tanacetum coccineum]